MRALSRLFLAIGLLLLAGAMGLRAAEKEKPVKQSRSELAKCSIRICRSQARMWVC